MSGGGFGAKIAVVLQTILLFQLAIAFADQIVLKNGKTIRGKKVTETDLVVVIQDEKGLFVNIPKSDIDPEKTVLSNKNQAPGKGRVVTREELEALREKHDLGLKSYGEAYDLQWSENEESSEDPELDREFDQEVLRASLPVIVDFYADWCQPCRVIAPRVDAIAMEYEGKAKVYRVNIDEKKSLAQQYDVSAIPTLIFFKDGEIVDRIVGAAQQTTIDKKLKALL